MQLLDKVTWNFTHAGYMYKMPPNQKVTKFVVCLVLCTTIEISKKIFCLG